MNAEPKQKQPKTVDALITLLGGSGKVAERLGCSQSAICNWNKRNKISFAWREEMARLAEEAGFALKDEWFVDPTRKTNKKLAAGTALI